MTNNTINPVLKNIYRTFGQTAIIIWIIPALFHMLFAESIIEYITLTYIISNGLLFEIIHQLYDSYHIRKLNIYMEFLFIVKVILIITSVLSTLSFYIMYNQGYINSFYSIIWCNAIFNLVFHLICYGFLVKYNY